MPTELTDEQQVAVLRDLKTIHPGNDAKCNALEAGAKAILNLAAYRGMVADLGKTVEELREALSERESAVKSLKHTLAEHKRTMDDWLKREPLAASAMAEAVLEVEEIKQQRDAAREQAHANEILRERFENDSIRLERERDEARQAAERATHFSTDYVAEHDRLRADVERIAKTAQTRLEGIRKLDLENSDLRVRVAEVDAARQLAEAEVARFARERHELVALRDRDWREALESHFTAKMAGDPAPNEACRQLAALVREGEVKLRDPEGQHETNLRAGHRADLDRICDALGIDRGTEVDHIIERAEEVIGGWSAADAEARKWAALRVQDREVHAAELAALEAEIAKLKSKIEDDACMYLQSVDGGMQAIAALEEQNAALLGDVASLEERLDSPPIAEPACARPHVERERLPDDRAGQTFKLRIGVKEELCEACGAPLPGSRVSGHLTMNRYPDGRLGEMFLALDRARRGDLAASFGHQLAIAISIGLQHGVPLAAYASRMRHVRDESGGVVMREVDGQVVAAENPRTVGSLVDLIAVVMERFAGGQS